MNGSFSPRGDNGDCGCDPNEYWIKDAARFVYEYGKNEALATVTQYRENGQQLRRLRYDLDKDRQIGFLYFDRERGEAERQGVEATVFSTCEVCSNQNLRTSIGQHRLRFDGGGLLIERRFEPLGGGASASDAKGAFGRTYRYNAAGLVESIRNLDAVGDTLVGKNGVAEVRRSYDAVGRLVSLSSHRKLGN